MISLDSRFLAIGDCFAQRFLTPGKFSYVLIRGLRWFDTAEGTGANPFLVEVGAQNDPAKTQPSQRNVLVKQSANGLVADPGHVSIRAGDSVLWYTTDSSLQGFSVFGETENFRFDSASITGEALYTHAFGSPGRYEWRDANQGAVRGVVDVKPRTVKTREDRQRFLEEVKKPNVIEISGNSVEPEILEIAIAQTVFWHIQRAPGITITDSRLLQPTADSKNTR